MIAKSCRDLLAKFKITKKVTSIVNLKFNATCLINI